MALKRRRRPSRLGGELCVMRIGLTPLNTAAVPAAARAGMRQFPRLLATTCRFVAADPMRDRAGCCCLCG